MTMRKGSFLLICIAVFLSLSFLGYFYISIEFEQPNATLVDVPQGHEKWRGYYHIARHYKWALNYVFHTTVYSAAVITEDDLVIAPDFFDYFRATYSLLKADKSLWCVSAWNDNGLAELINISESQLLHRTDFFPGMFYEKHLQKIYLNQNKVDFSSMDLSYLSKDVYDMNFVKEVYNAPSASLPDVMKGQLENGKPISDKSGVPRNSYRGTVSFICNGNELGCGGKRIFLTPFSNWTDYNKDWN